MPMMIPETEDSDRDSSSNGVEDQSNMTQEQIDGLRELWMYCAEQNVEIPNEIRIKIYGQSKSRSRMSLRKHAVLGMRAERLSKQAEMFNGQGAVIEDCRRLKEAMKIENPFVRLKIVNGSYRITQTVQKAKHKINTVGNKNLFYKLGKKVYKLATSVKSDHIPQEDKVEKVILDGINLSFESGKMYLVLGTPGSGKVGIISRSVTLFHSMKR